MALAVGIGADAFERVGLKPDLGALIVGVALGGHPKAAELSEKLLGIKDVLLVGFFLTIGLGGTPGPPAIFVAAIALLLLAVKSGGFMVALSRFRLRSRTTYRNGWFVWNDIPFSPKTPWLNPDPPASWYLAWGA